MPDNVAITPGSGANCAADEVSYSGDTAKVQMLRLVGVTGAEGSKTVIQDPISEGIGASADSAATAGGTGSLNAKLRLATTQLDSINTKSPALGQALAAASTPVVLPALTEGLFGALTETAPATDTASSGLNGRLQRIAQRLTSLIAQLPATLGIKTAAASLSVAPASDAAFVLGAGTNNIGDVDVLSVPAAISGPGNPVIDSLSNVAINVGAGATDSVLVAAPGANKQIWVYGITYICNVAGTVSIQDSDDTAITGVQPHGANGGRAVSPSGNFAMPLWKVATNKALEMDTVTCEVDGDLTYAIVSVA